MHYFRASIHAVRDETGQLHHLSGTVLDITENRLMEREIQNRVNELTCLFHVSRLLENRHASVETICQKIVAFIAPAMQFPQLATPAIRLDGVQYAARTIKEKPVNGLRTNIEVNGKVRGQVCVIYADEKQLILPEERDMLSNIARMLGLWLEQRETEAAVRAAHQELEELNRDLEKRVEERTTEISRREATYRALFENSNDGIFLLLPNGENLSANQKALNMLGYTLKEYQEITHHNVNAVASPDQRNDADERFSAALRGEYVPLYERTFVGKNGKRVDVEINLSPVRDATGKVIMVQSVVRDITERKKAEEALRESRDKLSAANAALEKASRLKDEFLASMSHELRTPLTGILGLSEALQMRTYGELNEKQIKALMNIETSGRHLLELINDILDLSKIEAGKLEMQFEPCSVSDICQASLQLVKGMAHQKRQNIAFNIDPVSIVVRADPRRLKQMLVNLLSNAVKFTPNGGELGLTVRENAAERNVELIVWDKGIGIQPENIDKLFKPFLQLDSSLARQYSGTGLGLSLVQRMAEMHGGSIQVNSSPGEGSQFTILLPHETQITQPIRGERKGDTGKLKNALVIEDNILDEEHASRHLKGLGISSIGHPTLEGAFEKAASLQPSAIILDLNLPDGSGFDLLARLKEDVRTRNIPVIISSIEERRSEARKLGASGYLLKPYTQQELRFEVEKAASFARSNDQIMVIEPPVHLPTILMADDNELILETVSDYLLSKEFKFIATRSGYEMLERAPEVKPDIILVDIQMPGLDGMETIRRLRAHSDPHLVKVPIIAVTALAMTGDREKCLAAGANEYLSKPVSLQNLEKRIRELLEMNGEQNE
jgi:PAS domain S-box-containing protein